MESRACPMLFSPIKVGTQEVKNRVFMPPVSTNLADRGYVSDALADALTETGLACHVLGDLKQCGNLRDAIEAGYGAACGL